MGSIESHLHFRDHSRISAHYDKPLTEEWESSQPELPGRLSRAVSITPGRAWRFVSEMDEIAKAFGAANLPEGFHQASAEINRCLAGFKD